MFLSTNPIFFNKIIIWDLNAWNDAFILYFSTFHLFYVCFHCTRTGIHTDRHVRKYTHTHAHTYRQARAYVRTHTRARTHIRTHVHIHTYTQVHTRRHTRAHARTSVCMCARISACGVVVSMFNFLRNDRGSNPGRGGGKLGRWKLFGSPLMAELARCHKLS